MPLRRAWTLPLLPTAIVMIIAITLVPITPPATTEHTWLLAVLITATLVAAAVATAASRVTGEPAGRPWTAAAITAILTAATPFAISSLLGGPVAPVLAIPWLIFGAAAAYWQLALCEGARSRPLHAAIGFGYTFVFTAGSLFLAVLSARLID